MQDWELGFKFKSGAQEGIVHMGHLPCKSWVQSAPPASSASEGFGGDRAATHIV